MKADKDRRFVLENGVEIPCIAFGTYKIHVSGAPDASCKTSDRAEGPEPCAGPCAPNTVVPDAIRAGYRYFDTASKYGKMCIRDRGSGAGGGGVLLIGRKPAEGGALQMDHGETKTPDPG